VGRATDARWYYDWGGGLIWFATDPRRDAGAAAIREAVRATGGHATLIRAPAEVRASIDVFEPQAEALARISAGIKASFDPAGVLNPGRMYAGI
jgi:glycolate oxidase FAD binding subunit